MKKDNDQKDVLKKKGSQDISFWHSLKAKILLLVFGAVLLTVCLNLWTVIPKASLNISNLTSNYMLDVATVAGEGIDNEIRMSSYNSIMTTGNLKNGDRPQPKVVEYTFNGQQKYAGMYVGNNKQFILVVNAGRAEAMSGITSIISATIGGSIFALLICFIIAIFLTRRIVAPIIHATGIVKKLGELDFSETAAADKKMLKRKDEVGVMLRSFVDFKDVIVNVMSEISSHSDKLQEAAEILNKSANESSTAAQQVETAITGIADGATSQAQETQSATENVMVMGNMIEEAASEVNMLG